MFGLGIFNIAAAVFRQIETIQQVRLQTTDPTWVVSILYLALTLEISLATVFVCIPPLAPYFSRFLVRIGLESAKSKKSKSGSSGAARVVPEIGSSRISKKKRNVDDDLFMDTQMDTLQDSTSRDAESRGSGSVGRDVWITQEHEVVHEPQMVHKRGDGFV